ncbi:MAG: DUF166 family protein [Candidatus Thorarchaeota archaeon]
MRLRTIYGDEFAERVLGNLINFSKFCQGCEPTCDECRTGYGSYVGDIIGIHRIDPPTPTMIEDPEKYIKDLELGECDVLLLVAIHHDILAAADIIVKETNAKAVIVPIENPTWVPPGLRAQVKETLDAIGVESAFPKPFCTLESGEGEIIDQFIERFKIGRPIHYVTMRDNVVSEIGPVRSAPCGCSWYVSQKVRGNSISDTDALFDIIAKAHHSYPCTASMAKDREVGDALLHIAGYNARYAICEAVGIDDCRATIEKTKE